MTCREEKSFLTKSLKKQLTHKNSPIFFIYISLKNGNIQIYSVYIYMFDELEY